MQTKITIKLVSIFITCCEFWVFWKLYIPTLSRLYTFKKVYISSQFLHKKGESGTDEVMSLGFFA